MHHWHRLRVHLSVLIISSHFKVIQNLVVLSSNIGISPPETCVRLKFRPNGLDVVTHSRNRNSELTYNARAVLSP